jgi:hypothetical protein
MLLTGKTRRHCVLMIQSRGRLLRDFMTPILPMELIPIPCTIAEGISEVEACIGSWEKEWLHTLVRQDISGNQVLYWSVHREFACKGKF